MIRTFGFVGALALCGLVGFAYADTHHNAQALLGNQLGVNGKHVLHKNGNHTAHAHVRGGKVAQVEVIHKSGKAVQVTKYMSKKKLHADAGSGVEHHYVSYNAQDAEPVGGVGIAYVGWGYNVGGVTVVYWFPVALVFGGPQGAILYVR